MKRPRAWFISGWSHPAGSLQPLADRLRDEFDTRCLGLHEPPLDAANPAEALAELLSSDPQPPDLLCGWSTGALAALEAAARRPVPPRLVCISGTARFLTGADRGAGMPPAQLRGLRAALRRDAGAALAGFDAACGCPPAPSFPRPVFPMDSLIRGLDYLAAADARAVLCDLPPGILWIHGQEDRIIPAAAARMDARAADRVVIDPDSGHALPLTRPGACAAEIRAWWTAG